MNEPLITPAIILESNQLDSHYFLKLKDTNRYCHPKGNKQYCFKEGFMLALIIDESRIEDFKYMLSTGEVELIPASVVLDSKNEDYGI